MNVAADWRQLKTAHRLVRLNRWGVVATSPHVLQGVYNLIEDIKNRLEGVDHE